MQHFKNITCYHCLKEGTTREHVPPKCLFPKESDRTKLLTVPSCEEHNSGNSEADEYLKFLLGVSASDVPKTVIDSTVRSIVRLAIRRDSGRKPNYGIQWRDKKLEVEESFLVNHELLATCLKKVARALYYHFHRGQRKLLADLTVWPLFIPVDVSSNPEYVFAIKKIEQFTTWDFNHLPKFGQHPHIFQYQVIDEPSDIVINIEFYGSHRVSVRRATA